MPADYKIDLGRKRVFSKGLGVLSKTDLTGHMSRLMKDPQFHPSFSQLLDFTEVIEIGISSEEIVALAEVRVFSAESKRAFVTPDPIKYGLARMYAAYRVGEGDQAIRVFKGMREALEWLDSDAP